MPHLPITGIEEEEGFRGMRMDTKTQNRLLSIVARYWINIAASSAVADSAVKVTERETEQTP
ncbi:hypothetical protein [Streptomyces alboflavus]|uniref:hypothetical protein n=1 Tax=Streptomyces alboflavus TaxID=67267 RepID=UPI0004BF17FC|nr:hypothetical protein [Streptomyces alboflavus]